LIQAEFGTFEGLFLDSGLAGCEAGLWGLVLGAMGGAEGGCSGWDSG